MKILVLEKHIRLSYNQLMDDYHVTRTYTMSRFIIAFLFTYAGLMYLLDATSLSDSLLFTVIFTIIYLVVSFGIAALIVHLTKRRYDYHLGQFKEYTAQTHNISKRSDSKKALLKEMAFTRAPYKERQDNWQTFTAHSRSLRIKNIVRLNGITYFELTDSHYTYMDTLASAKIREVHTSVYRVPSDAPEAIITRLRARAYPGRLYFWTPEGWQRKIITTPSGNKFIVKQMKDTSTDTSISQLIELAEKMPHATLWKHGSYCYVFTPLLNPFIHLENNSSLIAKVGSNAIQNNPQNKT